jgi:transposase-like protein
MSNNPTRLPIQENTPGDLTLMTVMSRFSTEGSSLAYFESVRWPDGPVCPHCGNEDGKRIYRCTPNATAKIRLGLRKCAECRETFTVRAGTVMEDSHIPLNKWLIAFYMMCASKTQMSALQLQRQIEIGSYSTALFLCHRIRFALMDIFPADKLTGTVEADETYIGGQVKVKGKGKGKGRAYVKNKVPVVSLVERGGRVRSRVMDKVTGKAITQLLKEQVETNAHLNTDESPLYTSAGSGFAAHDTVNHGSEEYALVDTSGRLATTNTVEGFFGNSNRSVDGTQHHISRQHTNLYLAELDHKYNTRKMSDGDRTIVGIQRMEGKRLMLRNPRSRER